MIDAEAISPAAIEASANLHNRAHVIRGETVGASVLRGALVCMPNAIIRRTLQSFPGFVDLTIFALIFRALGSIFVWHSGLLNRHVCGGWSDQLHSHIVLRNPREYGIFTQPR